MKKLIVLLLLLIPVSSRSATDISALPDLGTPATTSDSVITYDESAASGSRITEIKFDNSAATYLNGQGSFSGVTESDISDLSHTTANVSTTLSPGTIGSSSIAITSDGGADDVTLAPATNTAAGVATAAHITALEAATLHGASSGTSHLWIDQDVTSGSSPTFDGANITGVSETVTLIGSHSSSANHPTDANMTVLGNTSGTNTGDEVAADTTTSGISETATDAEAIAASSTSVNLVPANLAAIFADDTITIAGDWTFSGAVAMPPLIGSTSAPGTCTQGSLYHDTDATTGSQLLLCETTNNWVAQ